MQNNEAEELLKRYREGNATEEELDKLLFFVRNFETVAHPTFDAGELEAVGNEMWQYLSKTNPSKKIAMWPRIAVAASVIICLCIGGYHLFNKQAPVKLAQNQSHDVSPGTVKAILKVGGGPTIILDNTAKGLLARQGNTIINKTGAGKLAYSANSVTAGRMIYDTLEIPAGGKIYHLQLADGSKLVLNAATTLRFPENFSGDERKVELISGEAYFEVKHDQRMPFSVLTHGHIIEDIGTHFNINAYNDEPYVITTLLEGSIKVTSNNIGAILKPGQQSVIQNSNQAMLVQDADTDEAVAWKDGLFMFNAENLAGIMRQVSRWYNVEVVFKDPRLKNKLFSGSVSRFGNASQVLSKLALTGSVHFKITGRRIEVTK